MKKAMPYLVAEILLSLIISLFASSGISDGFLTMFGLVNIILGVIGLIFGVIFSIAKAENISKGLLISSALLLLMGFLTCSVPMMRLN
jgi:hypothetical protein